MDESSTYLWIHDNSCIAYDYCIVTQSYENDFFDHQRTVDFWKCWMLFKLSKNKSNSPKVHASSWQASSTTRSLEFINVVKALKNISYSQLEMCFLRKHIGPTQNWSLIHKVVDKI